LKTQNKFWWFVSVAIIATLGALLTISLLFWHQLPVNYKKDLIAIFKEDFAYFFMIGVLLFTAFGFTLDWFFRFYIIPVNQLAEETHLITTVNPQHRIKTQGSHDVMRLGAIINRFAERQAGMAQSLARQHQIAKASAETEKDILAALLEGLPQGILICNLEGQIVFYNRKIKQLFSRNGDREPQWIGLGRSIFGIVEEALIERAIERIGHKLAENQSAAGERFLMGGERFEKALPAEILPVLDSQHHITGFIIYVEDSVARFKKEQELFTALQNWRHQLTQSISVIKTAVEILKDEPVESLHDRDQLIQIIAHESDTAADRLSKSDVIHTWYPNRPWPLTAVNAGEWCRYLVHRAREAIQMELQIDALELNAQISIDMHHLTNSLLFVLQQIGTNCGIQEIHGRFYQLDAWLYLDLAWKGKRISLDTMKQWKATVPNIQRVRLEINLGDILTYHGAKLWLQHHHMAEGHAGVRFLIPALERSEMADANGYVTILPDSRPEFYDFDLFQQAGQNPELDNRALTDLTYTVFDTETTGLDPQGGDEIISIGAVRIVNGRILQEERFDQLINPMRHLPWASVKYHGIRPEMLEGQPTIEQVLPRFFKYSDNTVMVGHNVAFDMRMLQLKEASTGIRFTNPVLDTMLLSAVVHPAHNNHNLAAIAERLGVQIVGRHTALGDAIATGQIFLKLIPLLKETGVTTLLQARKVSEKTLYARLKY
jgi:DNA polymerase III subunit epsilon